MPDRDPLLAMRIGTLEFALERGRTYRIGEDAQCDIRIACGESVALTVVLADGQARITQTSTNATLLLRAGGTAQLSGIDCAVFEDLSGAAILPDPPKPVAQTLRAVTVPAAAGRTTDGESTFADMIAGELKRAPWFALSLILHALLFAIAWVVLGALPPARMPQPRYGYEVALFDEEPPPQAPETIPVTPETIDDVDPEPAIEPPGGSEPLDAPPPPDSEPQPDTLMRIGAARIPSSRASNADGEGDGQGLGTGEGNGDGDALAGGKGSGGFRKTVSELRRTGLEIVFVFDSTGSMGSSIRATKDGIAQMLDVLRGLVPDARFSLITYRDKGAEEDYLVRTLPLGRDFYAAINWMQGIEASGGGDTPEAVLAGLREAFGQDYRKGAKRVVVLAGDAPPHPREIRPVHDLVRRFVAEPSSSVHTLLTNGSKGSAADVFADIAKTGRGSCWPIEDQEKLLRQVLTLAFGAQFERDLDEVQRRLAAERSSPPTWARDLARRGGPDLAAALAGERIPNTLVHALLRPQSSRAAMIELVGVLASPKSEPAARQVAAHVLQMKLGLGACPIDAETARPIAPAVAASLRQRALALPE